MWQHYEVEEREKGVMKEYYPRRFFSLDYIESTPVKFMTNAECRKFLEEEDTKQHDKEIMHCHEIEMRETRVRLRLRLFSFFPVPEIHTFAP